MQLRGIRATIYVAFQTLAGVLNLAGPPLLGLLASRSDPHTTINITFKLVTSFLTITITSRFDTATVMLVLGASLTIGAAPLALASIVTWICTHSAFAPVPQTSDPHGEGPHRT